MEQFSVIGWLIDTLGLPHSWATAYIHVVMAAIVAMFLTLGAYIFWRRHRNIESRLIPEGSTSLTNLMEVVVGAVLRLMEDVMGPTAHKHLPLIGTLFIYILVSNLFGCIPGFLPPTENINTNLACAIVVFLYYNYIGVREQGLVQYFRHMAGPVLWLAPLILVIELISHLVRPVSLSVRLFGNLVGDHMVVGMFSQLVPPLLPIVFMGLAIFVSFMQAFVFTLLSIIYIHLAEESEDAH